MQVMSNCKAFLHITRHPNEKYAWLLKLINCKHNSEAIIPMNNKKKRMKYNPKLKTFGEQVAEITTIFKKQKSVPEKTGRNKTRRNNFKNQPTKEIH